MISEDLAKSIPALPLLYNRQLGKHMSALEKIVNSKSLSTKTHTISGQAGKGMVVAGGSALLVPILAAFIPFLGTLSVAVCLIVLGFLLWE